MQQQAYVGKKYLLFLLLILSFLVIFTVFAAKTIQVALLEGHCVKTTNTIGIAANVVKYREYRVFYADYYVTLDNPRGRTASWTRHESPLNIFFMAGLFWLTGSETRESQIFLARCYTWLHYLLAYLLIIVFLFAGNRCGACLFSLLYLFSSFTVYYSTRPFAETFAILHQALLLVSLAYLMRQNRSPYIKAGIIILVSALFCLAGKMNYFLIAGPAALLYPFFDGYMSGRRPKLQYFSVLLLAMATIVSLLIAIRYDISRTLYFFLVGNKGLYHGSPWLTFWEGFRWLPKIFLRTWNDFGSLVFWGGLAGFLSLLGKLAAGNFPRQLPPILANCRQKAILLLAFGHLVNYVVLRNLYIPHNYYLVPAHMIFVLALVSLIGMAHHFIASVRFVLPKHWQTQSLIHYFRIDDQRAGYIEKALKLAIFLTAISGTALLLLGGGLIVADRISQLTLFGQLAKITMLGGGMLLALAAIFLPFRLLNDILWRQDSGMATTANRIKLWQLAWGTLVAVLILFSCREHYSDLQQHYQFKGYFRKILADVKKFQAITEPDATVLCNNCCLGLYLDRNIFYPTIIAWKISMNTGEPISAIT